MTGGGGRSATRRTQLPDEVAEFVREQIISGEVKPGDFLRIEPVAEAIGVSNTPVREGLLALRSQGFVRLEPRRGFVVAPFSRQDVLDLFWTQAQLAGELAARAARKITPETLVLLEEINERYMAAVEERSAGDRTAGGTDDVADLGHQFHRQINLAAESPRLALLLGSVVRHLPHRFYADVEGPVGETRDDHRTLIEALRNGDVRRTRSLMEKHVLRGGEGLVATLDARGMWSDEP